MSGFPRFLAIAISVYASLIVCVFASEPIFLPVHPEPLEIVSGDSEPIAAFKVEMAVTFGQRATGLMHRKDFGGDSAMLFDFHMPQTVSMWMKNTPSALDMLFVGSDLRILAIERNTTPFSLAIIAPEVVSQYVVEIGAGEAQRRGIKVGHYLRHPTLERLGE